MAWLSEILQASDWFQAVITYLERTVLLGETIWVLNTFDATSAKGSKLVRFNVVENSFFETTLCRLEAMEYGLGVAGQLYS